jgi:hypothetical protein
LPFTGTVLLAISLTVPRASFGDPAGIASVAVCAAAFGAIAYFVLPYVRQGSVEVSDDRVTVHRRIATELYLARDILETKVESFSEYGVLYRTWCRLVSFPLDHRFVALRLRAQLKYGFLRASTSGVGLPVGRPTVMLLTDNPDELFIDIDRLTARSEVA